MDRTSRLSDLRRRSIWLAVGALAGALFTLVDRTQLRVVPTSLTQAAWLIGFAVLVVLGGAVIARRQIVAVLGVLFGLAGLLQLIADGQSWNPIPGGVGTAALFVALGIGAVAIAWAERPAVRAAADEAPEA